MMSVFVVLSLSVVMSISVVVFGLAHLTALAALQCRADASERLPGAGTRGTGSMPLSRCLASNDATRTASARRSCTMASPQ
jgi:hypothetical protein